MQTYNLHQSVCLLHIIITYHTSIKLLTKLKLYMHS